jgi:aldose sugar dehydrogenase
MTILIMAFIPIGYYYNFAEAKVVASKSIKSPIIADPNLKVELVARGLKSPTSMAFLGPNDILVLEKNNGTVQRIVNGVMLSKPLLDVNIANKNERGMLGIAVAPKHPSNGSTYVFLSYTETKVKGSDDCPKPSYCVPGHDPLGNRLYRYELVNNKLVNPKLLLDLPAVPGPGHNGGRILIGPDNNVYFTIGDVGHKGKTQNFINGPDPDGTSGILRITQDGKPVGNGILGNKYPLNLYYAYGIRNSFGIDFDPITKKLWDTENGPDYADEINLVYPGFNSGWRQLQGMWKSSNSISTGNIILNPTGLVDFGGKGKYSPPQFIWVNTTGPTEIKFLNSDKLGKQYENNMFVGDFHGASIYHFELNKSRTGLVLNDSVLADKIADTPQQTQDIIFGQGFGGITDIQVGPDGYLYVVSISKGAIYRILPINTPSH